MRTVVRARKRGKIKDEATVSTVVLEAIGITVSDGFRLMMVWVSAENRLPFELLMPNEETIAAVMRCAGASG